MEEKLNSFRLNIEVEQKVSYLSPLAKRSLTTRSSERINFDKHQFSSPKCVRASHEMLVPPHKSRLNTSKNTDLSHSVVLNNRRIGEKLLLDSFPPDSLHK